MTGVLVELPALTPGTPEWAAQRRRSIGGSEVAPLLGIGKWESRFSLWHRKQGLLDPQPDNPQMEWGRLLEPVIAAKYATEHPDRDVKVSPSFTRSDRPWQIASPDRLVGNQLRMLEVKTSYDDHGWGTPGTEEIPVYYRAQCIWYLDVLGIDICDVAVLIGGSDYREYVVHYAAAEAELMRTEAEAFITSLNNGDRPRIDEHNATYQAIRELHPDIEPDEIELPADLTRSYCTARHDLKAAEAEAHRQRALVADAMGTAQYAKFLGQTIARRQTTGNSRPFVVAGDNLPDFTKADQS